MAERVLSDDEVRALGLNRPMVATESNPNRERALSDDEVKSLGLDAPASPESGPKPSLGRSIVEGLVQGGSYRFGDELQGVLGGLNEANAKVLRPLGLAPEVSKEENIFGPSVVDAYNSERDAARRDREAAAKSHPDAFSGAEFVGALLAPGPKAAKSLRGFAKTGAQMGGAYALGGSDADLTKGDFLGAALDAAPGILLGGAGGLAAGAISKPLEWAANKVADWGRGALARGAEKANKPIDAALRSARSGLGGEVSAGSNALEKLKAQVADDTLSIEIRQGALEKLQRLEAQQLNERVARGVQDQFHLRLPNIEKAQTRFDEAVAAGLPGNRQTAVEEFMDRSPMKVAIAKTLARLGLPAAGYAIDKALGGDGAVGGGLGVVTGVLSGRPATILRNAAKSPQTQRSVAQGVHRLLDEAVPGALKGTVAEQAGNDRSKTRDILAPYLDLLNGDGDE